MRTKFAIKNIVVGLISQVVIVLLGFMSRKVFIDSLGSEYLGVNGVMTNILSMMVLIESGIGISIVYNLYKPLSENDYSKVNTLVYTYKKAYFILAVIMSLLSLGLYPFLTYFMKLEQPIPGLGLVYFIFVIKNIISYLNAYKWALINADQRGYVIARSNMVFQILTTITKIIVLVQTESYILFLIVELLIFIMQNLVNTFIVKRRYPYLNKQNIVSLDKETSANINQNVKAMFFHNIGGYLVTSTDNLLIAVLVSIKAVGLYSNYTMIISQLSALLTPVTSGISASVGNLIATEGREKTYSIFKTSYLISFWIYGFATIFLFNLLDPFISWWIGQEYLLDKSILIVILLNFYISGMRGPISTFKNKAGLFVQDKYVSVFEGIINLIGSIILIRRFGFIGVFLGTLLSTILTVFWTQPKVVYKELFQKSLKIYFVDYFKYLIILVFTLIITTIICSNIIGYTFVSLVIRGLICISVPNIIFLILFLRTKEVKYLLKILKNQIVNKINFKYEEKRSIC